MLCLLKAAFNMLICSIKNRHTHRNKCLLVSYMLCQVTDTLAIQFFIFSQWIGCYKSIKTLLRTHFTPASGTYMCTGQWISWFPFLVWSLPISPFLSVWSASVNVSLLNYLPGTINLLQLRGGKNLTSSKAVLNLRHPDLLSHIDQKIQPPENSWWSNRETNLGSFLDTQRVGLFVCLFSFLFFFSLKLQLLYKPRELREVWNQKCSHGNVMLVTIMKLQCYICTYRNLCVCICGRWWGERGKCRNAINFSNLHRYLPSWHIYSQTTRNVLQIRVIYNFLCLCQCPQPHVPARSSSPSTELRVRLCCVSSVHTLSKTLIFPTTPAVILAFCFPCMITYHVSFPTSFLLFCPSHNWSTSNFSHTSLCLCLHEPKLPFLLSDAEEVMSLWVR